MQLRLLTPPSLPLVEALRVQAHAWSVRHGHECRVVQLSNGGGYQIQTVPAQAEFSRLEGNETRGAA